MMTRRSTGKARIARSLWYVGKGAVELRLAPLARPRPGEALVRSLFSGISRGTERLVFNGAVGESEWERMRGPNQEGSFYGNVFQSPPKMYYCNGRNYNTGVVPGRIGSGNLNAPYTNPAGYNAYCDSFCTPADHPNEQSGYKACGGYNAIVTVWR